MVSFARASIAAVVLSLVATSGCVVRARGGVRIRPAAVVVVNEGPPPPRAYVPENRPGYIWVEGRWDRRGGQWAWMDGHWERQRANHRWEQGRWERRNNGHVWIEGRWIIQGGGNGNNRNNGNNGNGPDVRDHR